MILVDRVLDFGGGNVIDATGKVVFFFGSATLMCQGPKHCGRGKGPCIVADFGSNVLSRLGAPTWSVRSFLIDPLLLLASYS